MYWNALIEHSVIVLLENIGGLFLFVYIFTHRTLKNFMAKLQWQIKRDFRFMWMSLDSSGKSINIHFIQRSWNLRPKKSFISAFILTFPHLLIVKYFFPVLHLLIGCIYGYVCIYIYCASFVIQVSVIRHLDYQNATSDCSIRVFSVGVCFCFVTVFGQILYIN